MTSVRVEDLPEFDRLLHGIGRVAQAQASLEASVRMLHRVILSGTRGEVLSLSKGLTALVTECREMGDAFLAGDAEAWTCGKAALRSATEADKLRHRVVHDVWADLRPVDGTSNTALLARFQRTDGGRFNLHPQGLGDVEAAFEALVSAEVRINGLRDYVLDLDEPEELGPMRSRDRVLAQMRGDLGPDITLTFAGAFQRP